MFASSLLLYRFVEARWAVFFVLFLWPDLFMVGYLLNAKVGAHFYNLAHTDAFPLALGAVSVAVRQPAVMMFALIWLAHIGADRALGYGLKYPTFFKDTHVQRVDQ